MGIMNLRNQGASTLREVMGHMRITACVALFAGTLFVPTVQASIVIDFDEIGPNVVASLEGSLDTSTLTAGGSNGFDSGIIYGNPFFIIGSTSVGDWPNEDGMYYGSSNFVSIPTTSFATNSARIFSDLDAGPGFSVHGKGFSTPDDYVSGDLLDSTSTYLGHSFASLDLQLGTYVWALTNNETITLNVNSSEVPEPTTAALFLIGVAGLMLRRRRVT